MRKRPDIFLPYRKGPFLERLGLELISRADGKSHMWLDTGPWMKNYLGVVHGGILTSIADTVAGQAVLSIYYPKEPNVEPTPVASGEPRMTIVTTELHTSFLAPVMGTAVEAFGEVIHKGRSLIRARASLYSVAEEGERLILEALACFMLLPSTHASREEV